uniref:3Beta_HSD domain-containing protein n=1 Tax=Elaeophora elaphi TaxID=1147741 RepID=A0A0R3RN94_9BILA
MLKDSKTLTSSKMYCISVFHALVNNARVRGNIFHDDFLTLDDYKEVWEVNTCGVIRVTQTFRDLVKKSRGRIVMCSSTAVHVCVPGYGPYSSSKCAIQAYTDVIRHELGSYGVKVITISLGCFLSEKKEIESLKNMVDKVWYRASEDLRDEYGHDYNDQAKAFVNNFQSKMLSKDTSWVINSYYEAVVARWPKLFDIIGWDALLLFYPISWLPPFVQQYIVKFVLYLFDAPLPAMIKKNTSLKNN